MKFTDKPYILYKDSVKEGMKERKQEREAGRRTRGKGE